MASEIRITIWYIRLLYGYGSIPINTIFSGMNIHLPAILMWTTGVQGFDTVPYEDIRLKYRGWLLLYICTLDTLGLSPCNPMNFCFIVT